jgi:ABC-type multidrug transport system ATPase subunit
MLTTDLSPTCGDALINELSLVQEPAKTRRFIGYCPQFDGLNSVLTSAEHIRYYAKIRGIQKSELKDMVNWALQELNLTEYRDIPAGEYSGGNKRKLSTAIAFTGAPDVILLDEPTAGVDPKARRFLWDVIKRMVLFSSQIQ